MQSPIINLQSPIDNLRSPIINRQFDTILQNAAKCGENSCAHAREGGSEIPAFAGMTKEERGNPFLSAWNAPMSQRILGVAVP